MNYASAFARILTLRGCVERWRRLTAQQALRSAVELLYVRRQHQIHLFAVAQPLEIVLAPLGERLLHSLSGVEVFPALVVLQIRVLRLKNAPNGLFRQFNDLVKLIIVVQAQEHVVPDVGLGEADFDIKNLWTLLVRTHVDFCE